MQNLKRKEAYKTAAKNIRALAAAGKQQEAAAFLPRLYKALDKAAKTSVIAKRKASRLKSRLTQRAASAVALG